MERYIRVKFKSLFIKGLIKSGFNSSSITILHYNSKV